MKKVEEHKKVLESDYQKALQDIDRNFNLKMKEMQDQC